VRILFLTQRLPYAPNKGDRVRALNELRMLARRHEVHLVSLVHDEEEASHAAELTKLAASVSVIPLTRVRNAVHAARALATTRPLTHALLDGSAARDVLRMVMERYRPELAFAFCSSMARFVLEPPVAGLPYLLDMVDVDSAKWAALAPATGLPKRWVYGREARVLGQFEALAAQQAAVTFVVNEREARTLRDLAGGLATVRVLPNGVDTAYLQPSAAPADTPNVVFCGVMDYAPNEQGALWLASEVWPQVLAQRPDARLYLVGANPGRSLRAAAARIPSVCVTGTVPDVRPFLWEGAVAAAPLMVARGVQNKVLEAVAAGLPAVVTTPVAEGLPAEVMPACVVGDSADGFAGHLLRMLALTPPERRAAAMAARLEALTWESRLAPLQAAIAECRRMAVH
jgi:polysaccharide biosynthesis protein PslH